jgi:hypothetical protein
MALPTPLSLVVYYRLSPEARTIQHIHQIVLGVFRVPFSFSEFFDIFQGVLD